MATLAPVDTSSKALDDVVRGGDKTPTAPTHLGPSTTSAERGTDVSTPRTPTSRDFGGLPGQRALPGEPLTPSHGKDEGPQPMESLKRDMSQRSSIVEQNEDVEMGEGEDDIGDDEDGSDNDSVTSDSQRPSKKKKGQRFFCTDYPPCQLSFTRSEHLARHIRKHTGERPFQCHCSRRFSRLDNLRQHAQTVHVNEEIPGDSLAATSTRFQRQIRTDRVRPPTSRSRASTINSMGGHSRGHSRNLSTSSIGSTTSNVSVSEDARRRPQPLAMANDPASRARLSLNTYNSMAGTPLQPPYGFYDQSPTGYSTPTSTFSTGTGSPRFQSNMVSPSSTISRSSFYNGARRRLSVPSASPFLDQSSGTYPPPMYYNPMVSGTSPAFANNGSVFGSPTSSVFSQGRRDSEAEAEYRRRTWHPGTYANYTQRPATSGLSYYQTPDDQRPAMSEQPAASQFTTRLPGIESFDHAPPTNARQQPSPMMMDPAPRPTSSHRPSDAGLHQGLTRLDITAANAPVEAQWQSHQPQMVPPQGYVVRQPTTVAPQQITQQHPMSMPEQPVTPRRNKRQAWYNGPLQVQSNKPSHRPSPEDSGSSDGVPTPGTSQGTEYHPLIVNPAGPTTESYPSGAVAADDPKASYVHQPTSQMYALQSGHDPRFSSGYTQQPQNNDMGRLEALVAVATSENRAVERS